MRKNNNSDSKKIKELIRKVRTLAERGDKGEREVAKEKLRELMNKYHIKKFEESKSKKRSFKLADFNDCKTIMIHCILDTQPKAKVEGSLQKKELYCNLTDEEYIDVCEKFNHYFPEFHKQRDFFVKAFILSNDLGIVEDVFGEDEIESSLNSIMSIMKNIKPTSYKKHKQLESTL